MFAEFVFVDDAFDVRLDLGAGGVDLGPLGLCAIVMMFRFRIGEKLGGCGRTWFSKLNWYCSSGVL